MGTQMIKAVMARLRKVSGLYRTLGFRNLWRAVGSLILPGLVLYWVFVDGAPREFLISVPIFIALAWMSMGDFEARLESKVTHDGVPE
jgi:hypothetical protein